MLVLDPARIGLASNFHPHKGQRPQERGSRENAWLGRISVKKEAGMSKWPGAERLRCEDGSGRPECAKGKETSEPGLMPGAGLGEQRRKVNYNRTA